MRTCSVEIEIFKIYIIYNNTSLKTFKTLLIQQGKKNLFSSHTTTTNREHNFHIKSNKNPSQSSVQI